MALHYLVDGFNLLYALAEMPAGRWEQKRQALLDLLHERTAARTQPHDRSV